MASTPIAPVPSDSPEENKWSSVDHKLWLSLALGPLAAGIETTVGYTVSHYACDTRHKTTLVVVVVFNLLLCAAGLLLANSTRGTLGAGDDVAPGQERRIFMMRMAILLCAFCALLTVAGATAVIILDPCD